MLLWLEQAREQQDETSHYSGHGKTLSFTLRSELWRVVHRRAYLTCALQGPLAAMLREIEGACCKDLGEKYAGL